MTLGSGDYKEAGSAFSSRMLGLKERLLFPEIMENSNPSSARGRLNWWTQEIFNGNSTGLQKWLKHSSEMRLADAERVVEAGVFVCWPRATGQADWHKCLVEVLSGAAWLDLAHNEVACKKIAEDSGLGTIFYPFLLWARDRLGKSLRQIRQREISGSSAIIENDFVLHLARKLRWIGTATAALAANVSLRQSLLLGANEEEKTSNFSFRLLDSTFREQAVRNFPVLDRRFAHATMNAVQAFEAFLANLSNDWEDINEKIGPLGDITTIKVGLGDPHKGGHTVCSVHTDAGNVIYKPRSMKVDCAFQDFVNWVNEKGGLRLPVMKVLDCGDYGWAEFISDAECESEDEISLAFNKMGGLLALLNICGANDIHYENLIFRGRDPFVVDLETLMSPFPKPPRRLRSQWLYNEARHRTLLRVAYLPYPMKTNGNVIDLSGAGFVNDQEAPFQAPFFEDGQGGAPHVRYQRNKMSPQSNSPKFGGKIFPAQNYTADLISGFEDIYSLLLKHKQELGESGSPVRAFEDVEVRFVPRPTMEYGKTLINSYHPSAMRDGGDQDVTYARLLMPKKADAHLDRLLSSEAHDLWATDIPYFTTRSNSKDLYNSSGRSIKRFFSSSGFEFFAENLAGLSSDDLARQKAHIETSFASATMRGGPDQPAARIIPESSNSLSDDDFLEESKKIAEKLLRDAVHVGENVYWLGLTEIGESRYSPQLGSGDIYSGSGGIGVFFAELWRVTEDERYKSMAWRCLNVVRSNRASDQINVGGYQGSGSTLYSEYRIGAILDDISIKSLKNSLLVIRKLAKSDNYLDVIVGAAGGLLAALSLVGLESLQSLAIDTAICCGRRLRELAVRDEQGTRWRCPTVGTELTGFSHGTTGIAYALASLAAATGQEEYAHIAWDALRFESHSYNGQVGAWRDLRSDDAYPTTWCHGSVGMTLGRQKMLELQLASTPEFLLPEIHSGLAAILRGGGGGSHCLCHGTFGNIEPLLRGGEEFTSVARRVASNSVKTAREEARWRCGIAGYEETAGLMVGMAGIGLGLLRVRDPSIKSILLLE